jgi:hypothetical protein
MASKASEEELLLPQDGHASSEICQWKTVPIYKIAPKGATKSVSVLTSLLAISLVGNIALAMCYASRSVTVRQCTSPLGKVHH